MKNLDLRTFAELMVAMVGQRGILCHVGERNGCICVTYENDDFVIDADVNLLWQKYTEGKDVTELADTLAEAIGEKIDINKKEYANKPKAPISQPIVNPAKTMPKTERPPYGMNQVNQTPRQPQNQPQLDMNMVNKAARQAVKEVLGIDLPEDFDASDMFKKVGIEIPNGMPKTCSCNPSRPSGTPSGSFEESLKGLTEKLGGNTARPQYENVPSDEDIKFTAERVRNNIRPIFISDEMKAEMSDVLSRKVLGMNLAYYMPEDIMNDICKNVDGATGVAFLRTAALDDSGMKESDVYEAAMNNLAPHVRIETAGMENVTSCAVISDEDCGAAGVLCKGVLSSIADAFGEENLYVLVMNCNETAIFPASRVNVGNLKAIIDNEAREEFDIMGDLLLYNRENDVLAAPSYNI